MGPPAARIEAHNAIVIAAITTKVPYDTKDTPEFFRVGGMVQSGFHT